MLCLIKIQINIPTYHIFKIKFVMNKIILMDSDILTELFVEPSPSYVYKKYPL
jgi:hypothetical protein